MYGAAHPHLGETVEAEVVLWAAIEPEALRAFCRVHLSADKVPSRIRLIHAVAKTAVTGKVRRPIAPPVA